MAKAKYYDWDKTRSYVQARVYMVLGAKGVGKTFGARVRAVQDYLDGKGRFVEICRHKSTMQAIAAGYFDRLQERGYFGDRLFKTVGGEFFTGVPGADGEVESWEKCGYIVALSQFQLIKQMTFSDVGTLIFDECVIDKKDKYHRYLPDEVQILANAVDSICRENAGESNRAKIVMLGNACDFSCPYMEWLGISTPPKFGYHWYRKKTVLLHYAEPQGARERQKETLAGLMLEGDREAEMVFENKFSVKKDAKWIKAKSKNAKFRYAYAFAGWVFGCWVDDSKGLVYINDKVPKNSEAKTLHLTDSEGSIDYEAIKRADYRAKFIVQCWYGHLLRYDRYATKAAFVKMLSFLGIKE